MKRSGRRNRYEDKPMADINVTPLVDVVLVLLIIFMVTAPMLQMGIDVNLPRVEAKSVDISEEKIVLTVKNNQEIFINKYKTSVTDLRVRLANLMASRIDREVFLRADRSVPYGFVVEVMSEVRKAGVDRLGMITEPPEESR
ncbi:MAG: biopolymer transporter ExbD [Deltaproteobacteria bacterium]|nr:biopolymer transporter ExbD [Deltaproteobacteria bacterium]